MNNCDDCLKDPVEAVEPTASGYSGPSVFAPGTPASYANVPAIGPMPGLNFDPDGQVPVPVVADNRHIPVVVHENRHIPVVVAGYEVIS